MFCVDIFAELNVTCMLHMSISTVGNQAVLLKSSDSKTEKLTGKPHGLKRIDVTRWGYEYPVDPS